MEGDVEPLDQAAQAIVIGHHRLDLHRKIAAGREQQELANNKTLLLPTLLPGSTFWTNEWLPNYEEVRIKRLGTQADLRDLAREAGLLLAAEHQKKSAISPIVEPARLAIDREFETLLRTQAKELADETQSAYEAFRKDFNVGK
jgi:hypothetical protein